MAALGINDAELGRRLKLSRQAVHAKRTGRTVMTLDDLADVAEALDVEPWLFLGPPHQALAWLVEHRAEVLDGATALEHKGCLVLVPSVGATTTRRAIMPVPVGAGAQTGVSAAAA